MLCWFWLLKYGCVALLAYKPTPKASSSKFSGKLSAYTWVYMVLQLFTVVSTEHSHMNSSYTWTKASFSFRFCLCTYMCVFDMFVCVEATFVCQYQYIWMREKNNVRNVTNYMWCYFCLLADTFEKFVGVYGYRLMYMSQFRWWSSAVVACWSWAMKLTYIRPG